MAKAHTTATLIRKTVAAAIQEGVEVGAIEVAPGGMVRIIARDAVLSLPSSGRNNTCDELFGADRCD